MELGQSLQRAPRSGPARSADRLEFPRTAMARQVREHDRPSSAARAAYRRQSSPKRPDAWTDLCRGRHPRSSRLWLPEPCHKSPLVQCSKLRVSVIPLGADHPAGDREEGPVRVGFQSKWSLSRSPNSVEMWGPYSRVSSAVAVAQVCPARTGRRCAPCSVPGPVPHLRQPELPLQHSEPVFDLGAHTDLHLLDAPGDEVQPDERVTLAPQLGSHRHVPRRPRFLKPLVQALVVASITEGDIFLAVQQRAGLPHMVDVGGRAHHAVHEARVEIHADVSLDAELPHPH